jgi:hypothetical protein
MKARAAVVIVSLGLLNACRNAPSVASTPGDAGTLTTNDAGVPEEPPPPPACVPSTTDCSADGWCPQRLLDDEQPVVAATSNIVLRADNTVLFWNYGSPSDLPRTMAFDRNLPLRTFGYFHSSAADYDNDLLVLVGDGVLVVQDCYALPCIQTPPTHVPERLRAVSVDGNFGATVGAFAVGDAIYQWSRDTGWVRVYDPGDLLEGVSVEYIEMYQYGDSYFEVFAVGKRGGVIIRHDANGWHEDVPIAGVSQDFRFHAVQSFGSSVIAVGDNGTAVRWDTDHWQPLASNTTEKLLQIVSAAIVGEQHVYAIESDHLVLLPDTVRPAVPIDFDVRDNQGNLRVDGPVTWGFPATVSPGPTLPLQRCEGQSCQTLSQPVPPVTGIVTTTKYGTWAVTGSNTALRCESDGWHPMAGGAPDDRHGIQRTEASLYGSDKSGLWSFGIGIGHFDGRRWEMLQNGDYYFWCSYNGILLDYDPAGPLLIRSCHGFSDQWSTVDVFPWASTPIGTALDEFQGPPSPKGLQIGAAAACDGDILVGGTWPIDTSNASNELLRWDGQAWTTTSGSPDTIVKLWADHCDDAWAIMSTEKLNAAGTDYEYHYSGWHWVGGGWVALNLDEPLDVWGRASDDVWIVGRYGAIWHWDGQSWTAQDSGTTVDLLTVTGNDHEVWIGGDCGTILHRGR